MGACRPLEAIARASPFESTCHALGQGIERLHVRLSLDENPDISQMKWRLQGRSQFTNVACLLVLKGPQALAVLKSMSHLYHEIVVAAKSEV